MFLIFLKKKYKYWNKHYHFFKGSKESTTTEDEDDSSSEEEGEEVDPPPDGNPEDDKTKGTETEAGAEISALVNYVQPVHFSTFENAESKCKHFLWLNVQQISCYS